MARLHLVDWQTTERLINYRCGDLCRVLSSCSGTEAPPLSLLRGDLSTRQSHDGASVLLLDQSPGEAKMLCKVGPSMHERVPLFSTSARQRSHCAWFSVSGNIIVLSRPLQQNSLNSNSENSSRSSWTRRRSASAVRAALLRELPALHRAGCAAAALTNLRFGVFAVSSQQRSRCAVLDHECRCVTPRSCLS